MIQPAIRSMLVNDPGVAAMVSGRVYDIIIPETSPAAPFLVLQKVSETLAPVIMEKTTSITVDAYALTHTQADELADRVCRALNNRAAETNDEIIHRITQISQRDMFTSDTRLFRVTADYRVVWRTKQP